MIYIIVKNEQEEYTSNEYVTSELSDLINKCSTMSNEELEKCFIETWENGTHIQTWDTISK